MDIKLEQIRAFGPSILKVQIPEKIVNDLNSYVDQVINDEKKSADLNHGKRLVADVKQEFVIEKDFTMKSGWGNFLGACVRAWIKKEMQKERAEAIAWLTGDSDDFRDVCIRANMQQDYVRQKAKEARCTNRYRQTIKRLECVWKTTKTVMMTF